MKDFLGQEITVGCYIATDGGGNTKAQYGLILKKVIKVTKDAIHCISYKSYYLGGTLASLELKESKSTLTNHNKVVVVKPPKAIIDIFENPQQNTQLISAWIHGSATFKWE